MPELLVHQKLQQEQERQQLEKERQQREQEAQHARSVECVMGAIDTRHHELLEELLALDEWSEEELSEFFWHAAVEALNGPALQMLHDTYNVPGWTRLLNDDSQEALIFSLLKRAQAVGWECVLPVLHVVVAADASVLSSRLGVGPCSDDTPLLRALRLRPAPPLEVVQLLAPKVPYALFLKAAGGERAATLLASEGDRCSQQSDRERLQAASAYFQSVRAEEQARQDEQRRLKVEAEKQRAAEAAERKRQQEAAARARAERQAREAAAAAERHRQQELRKAAEAEQRRREKEAAAQQAFRALPRSKQFEVLRNAAGYGNLPDVRMIWQLLSPLARDEAAGVMRAAVSGCQARVVALLRQAWSPKQHGDWHAIQDINHYGRPQHVIFSLLERHQSMDDEEVGNNFAIIAMLLEDNPGLACTRTPDGTLPVGYALQLGLPASMIHVLAPMSNPIVATLPTGKWSNPAEHARRLASTQRAKWKTVFLQHAQYLDSLEQAHMTQLEAKLMQSSKKLHGAVQRLHEAVDADNCNAMAAFMKDVLTPEYKEVHDRVLPPGGLPVFLESVMLRAPSMAALQVLHAEGRIQATKGAGDPGFAARLLDSALSKKRYALARQLLQHNPACVSQMPRPPLCLALHHQAPPDLLSTIVRLCMEQRSGGICEADSSLGSPAVLAVQHGRLDVLHQLLEAGIDFCTTSKSQRTTLLWRCISLGKEEASVQVLRHVRTTLQNEGEVAAHVNTLCSGSTALFKAVEQMPASDLIGELLSAGADPSVLCEDSGGAKMAVHVAAATGHMKLTRQLLDSVPRRQQAEVVVLAVGQPKRTLLHFAMDQGDKTLQTRLLTLLDKERRQQLMQLALDQRDEAMLSLLLQQLGISAAALSLHRAMAWLPRGLVQQLVTTGAPINQTDPEDGSRLAHKVVKTADLELLGWLLDQEGANIEARDSSGNTLLHWAAVFAPTDMREAVMRLLVSRNPRLLTLVNKENKSPMQFARSKQPKHILQRLEQEYGDQDVEAEGEAVLNGEPVSSSVTSSIVQPAAKTAAVGSVPMQAAADDLTQLGPKGESEARKRQRIAAMTHKLTSVLAALREQQQEAGEAAEAASEAKPEASSPFAQQSSGPPSNAAADGGHAAAAADEGQQQDEGGALKRVVKAAVQETMPDAVPGTLQDADAAFSDDEAEELGGGDAELVAAAEAADLPFDMGGLQQLLVDLPWEFTITRDAWHEWLGMDAPYRRMVLMRVQQIGRGLWLADGKTQRRTTGMPPTLELWRTKLTKGGRIIFEVAADYSESSKGWRDMLRLWVITLDHNSYMKQVDKIRDSHRKSQLVRDLVKLRPRAQVDGAAGPAGKRERLPTYYDVEGADAGEEEGSGTATAGDAPLRLFYPPASAGHNNYTLLKFYKLSSELVHAVLVGLDENSVDFSFRVSPAEQRIIELVPNPPRTIILLGRSGTGKTTCSVFRMWGRWLAAWQQNRVFNQVARSFSKLRVAAVPELADVFAEAAAKELHSLHAEAVPAEAFPLFLSSRQFLRLLDGTIEQPFFPRRADVSIMWGQAEGEDFDPDGMNLRVELDAAADMEFDDSEEEEGEEDASDDGAEVVQPGANADGAVMTKWRQQEVTFPLFLEMWKFVANKDLRTRLKPGLVWLEINSFIKGSAEAVRTQEGRLGLAEYLEIGRKRAPNFDCDSRRLVHEVYCKYQQYKRQQARYDNADLVAHVYRQLAEQGYQGVPIHNLYRDEVQDFTQAELLMDLRIVSDPNGLFLCGDTAQTIARGVGFRFTDIQTLFYEERQSQLALEEAARVERGSSAAGGGRLPEVHMPLIEHLKVNYRTHSGILEAASSVVDGLKRFYPQHIDHLDRERAFFKGPKPLLLSTVTTDDLAILLSWTDKSTSQVEFGAHQVVLVRSMDSVDRLPEGLRESNALVLTVPQSKGLEFDDVFLVNFCTESPAKEEWRILLQYLEELERIQESGGGIAAMPGKQALVPAQQAAEGIGELGKGALRPLDFDQGQHKMLCEELKHLYTAITRAKNSVVIYDENAAARAPLYFYLARRGLARVVARSLMEEGVDSKDLGVTKARSTPADWAAQGRKLLDQGIFEAAAKCYERAGDVARAQQCYELLALAVNGQPLRDLLPPKPAGGLKNARPRGAANAAPETLEEERRMWIALAARSLQQAGEKELAVQLWMAMGHFKQARQLLETMGDPACLADCCTVAAAVLRAQGQAERGIPWLAEAVKQYKNLKQYTRCFELLDQEPALIKLLQRKNPSMLQDIGVCAMREMGEASAAAAQLPASQKRHQQHQQQPRQHWEQHQPSGQQGQRQGTSKARLQERLVAASRLIQDHGLRVSRLEAFGCYSELALVVKEPVRAGQLLSEHVGYGAAIDRLLEAGQSEQEQLPSSGLRLLLRLVTASGTPDQLAAAWDLLESSRSSSLAASRKRLQADLALRLACQLTGLQPLTALPMAPEAATAADQRAAAAKVALRVVSSLPEPADAAGISSEATSELGWAQRLAGFAAGVYGAVEASLDELRCQAVLAAAGLPALPLETLQRGMQLADAMLARCALLKDLLPSQARNRPPLSAERAALQQLESLFDLTGLASTGSDSSTLVTAPRFDPGLPALAEAFNCATAVHGQQEKLAIKRQSSAAAGAVALVDEQTASLFGVRRAVAFYLFQLAHSTAIAHLASQSSSAVGGSAASAVAAPPGLRSRGSLEEAEAAFKELGGQFRVVRRLHQLSKMAKQLFPALRSSSGSNLTGTPLALADVERRLAQSALRTAFPSGPVDGLPSVLPSTTLGVDWVALETTLRDQYRDGTSSDACTLSPNVSFDIWRALTFLIRSDTKAKHLFRNAAQSLKWQRQDHPGRRQLVQVEGRAAVPAMLLVAATERLQCGMAAEAADALLLYLERCWAAAHVSGLPAGQEAATASTAGTPSEQQQPLASGMLTELPFLSHEHTAADLHFHAACLAAAGREKLQALWQRLGAALCATVRGLVPKATAAADAAAGGGTSTARGRQEAQDLLGRLSLAAGSFLASLAVAVNSGGGKESGWWRDVPADVPGALYAALETAAPAVPRLKLPHLTKASSVGALVGCVLSLASSLGTAVILVTREAERLRPFDGFARSGPTAKLSGLPVSFRARAIEARASGAGDASRMPLLTALQKHSADDSQELTKNKAALVIQQHWRALKRQRARRWAVIVLKGTYFKGLMRGHLQRAQAAREKAAQEEAAREAMEKRRATAQSDGGAMDRYTYLEQELLSGSHMTSAAQCLICHRAAPQPTGASTKPSAAAGGSQGGRLNPSAPSFLPHVHTDGHAAQLAAFQAYVAVFKETLAVQMVHANSICLQLEEFEGAAYVNACSQRAQLEPWMRKADAVLASIDSQHSWQQTQAVVEMAEELQAACLAGQSWLDSQAEQQIAAAAADAAAAAEGEAGAHGGYLHAHERDAAELQAALVAMAEQQEDGGWTSVGTASRPAAPAAEEEEEEDMEESHGIAGQNAYAALLDDNEGWEDVVSGKNKKNRSRGGHNQRRGGKGRRS
ncbi:hypothetical protein D9Q98_008134 [Chlorella vulgaris]|uniref:UvrD-like helicase ATP-binding domain-containing protein n=1 Tax=Chlorella vulgaris TaxID=3077 RepID=A0A9D4TG45_CHLVU|nr:hypothetical protein D9Q98_008134 [Chlorella vulgaris]